MSFDFGTYIIASKRSIYTYRYFSKYDIGVDDVFLFDTKNKICKLENINLIKNL